MYQKGYGIIEALAPVHVGAAAGEETGNLNLIFRDQFTKTGIIPGSSIRGRFRADMREKVEEFEYWYGKDARSKTNENTEQQNSQDIQASDTQKTEDNRTTEGIVKFEYASLLWLPVYCPGQPVVRVSCPSLLKRYQKLAGLSKEHQFQPYSYYRPANTDKQERDRLFFNLGLLPLKEKDENLENYIPSEVQDAQDYLLLIVKDTEIGIIHDMALYRQSRVKLKDEEKIVDGKGFFNVEALPEKTILVFPIAVKKSQESEEPWPKFLEAVNLKENDNELYFGGLESVGFGRTQVTLKETPKAQKQSDTTNQ